MPLTNPKHARQVREMPKSSLRDDYERKQYLKTQSYQRDKMLKQFCKHEVPTGSTEAYRSGWDLVWGKGKVS